MTEADKDQVREAAYAAAKLTALCRFIATALTADPDTSIAGCAVEGLESMAGDLSRRLFTIAGEV